MPRCQAPGHFCTGNWSRNWPLPRYPERHPARPRRGHRVAASGLAQVDWKANVAWHSVAIDDPGRGDILKRSARAVEHHDLFSGYTARPSASHDVGKLGVYEFARHRACVERVVEIAHDGALLQQVHDDRA